jgi:diaminopimelate epimerase
MDRVTTVRLEVDGDVSCDMGTPEFEPSRIPFLALTRGACYELRVTDGSVLVSAVSMGNPHAVLRVDDVEAAPVATLGPEIERHERFPAGANVGFMQVLDPANIALRVHERGVGETLACGTGACAAVACGRELGLLEDRVTVGLPGGRLAIEWLGGDSSLWMRGPAVWVFEGSTSL